MPKTGVVAILLMILVSAVRAEVPRMEAESEVVRTMPEPWRTLKDNLTVPSSSTVVLDPSGRSGTFRVTAGSSGNMVLHVAFSADGHWLIAGRFRGQLDVWDTQTWIKVGTLRGDSSRVTAVAMSPEGELAAVGGDEKTVKILEIPSGKQVAKLPKCNDYPDDLVFSPDGHFLAVLVNGGPDFAYDLRKHKVAKEFPANGAAFLTSEQVFLTALTEKLTLWDAQSWTATRELRDPGAHIHRIALDEERHRVVAGALEGPTKVWDLSSGTAAVVIDAGFIANLFVTQDGRHVITAGDGFIRMWSAESGEIECTSPKLKLHGLSFSRDRRWMAAGVDDGIEVWSAEDVMRACAGASD
ncbi:MAG TPA: hypothetical protein VGS03_11585 [Candidatus Polarisedimenticolia bacterium]|jgi:WD40 repeat protein|nr:hypothetical protein [Candidatus Polarisedimenticolia bacterium]